MKKILFLIIVFLFSEPFLNVSVLAQSTEVRADFNLKSWMSEIDDERSIAALSIPGTHDSGANFGCKKRFATPYAKTQDLSIREQLEIGIRYLDIRCRRSGNRFLIHHGQCFQHKEFDDVLIVCQDFLIKHPSETILMRIKEEHNPEKEALSFASIFERYKNQFPGIWYEESSVPDLKAARGKIIIINDAEFEGGISFSDAALQDDFYFKKPKYKWEPVRNHLEQSMLIPTEDYLVLNHLSATGFNGRFWNLLGVLFGTVASPRDFSNYILPLTEEYLDENPKGRCGILIMDFPDEKINRQIIRSNDF